VLGFFAATPRKTRAQSWYNESMKLAILADIHANYAALRAVASHIDAWNPDVVLVNGDIVNRGPQPRACLEFVLERRQSHGWQLIQGNHEEYVLFFAARGEEFVFPPGDLRGEIRRGIEWTTRAVADYLPVIDALPRSIDLPAPDGSLVQATHASVRGNRDGIYADSPADEARRQISAEAQLFITAHTHVPVLRRLDETLIVNSGSVGLPFDGDTRASYAQVVWEAGHWQAAIIRLEYERSATERDFTESGLMDAAGPVGRLMLHEIQSARSLMFTFIPQYQQQVLSGAISLEDAVTACLEEADSPAHSFGWSTGAPQFLRTS
jgi:predicted phosphodiesterase